MRKYADGLSQIGSPRTVMLPLLGLSCPVMSFINVDLPAPLGPRSPVMPCGTVSVTSFRPMTCPYHFDRCSVATTLVLSELTPRSPRRGSGVQESPPRRR